MSYTKKPSDDTRNCPKIQEKHEEGFPLPSLDRKLGLAALGIGEKKNGRWKLRLASGNKTLDVILNNLKELKHVGF